MGWELQSLSFDAFLHLGTALAIVYYFRNDLLTLIKPSINDIKKIASSRLRLIRFSKEFRYLTLIIIGSLPVGIGGLLLEDIVDLRVRNEYFVLSFLFFISIYMILAEKLRSSKGKLVDISMKKEKERKEVNIVDTLLIGLAQAFSLFPGVSRSGFTISTALMQNLDRELAIRFSFLLSIPAVLAAGIYKFGKMLGHGIEIGYLPYYLVGGITAFVVGLFAVNFIIKFLRTNSLVPFAIYRIVLVIIFIASFF